MSTASITHHHVPMAAAAAAAVAAVAFVGITVVQNDAGSEAPSTQTSPVAAPPQSTPNPKAHYQRPVHSGDQAWTP
jgi:hypothetical protein